MPKPLEGIRVLDCSRMLAGPFCGMVLADFGADVIRVEPPGGALDRHFGPFAADGMSLVPLCTNRNKQGITLDLRAPEGQELLHRLVDIADVVVHNYTPGTEEERFLSYNRLCQRNPRIIVACVSGYGLEGPYAAHSAIENILQAESGAMSFTGFPGNPPTRCAVPYVDVLTGTNAALGVMLALHERERSGRGQCVDVALMDAATSILAAYAIFAEQRVSGEIRRPIGNHSFWAYSDTFPTQDDAWVVCVVLGKTMWRNFLAACEQPELEPVDPRTLITEQDRRRHRERVSDAVRPWFAAHSAAEALARLERARIPCGRVNDIAEVQQHPQLAVRDMLPELDYDATGPIPVNGVSIKLSRTPGDIRARAPLPGTDNDVVYGDLLGLRPEQIAELRRSSVI